MTPKYLLQIISFCFSTTISCFQSLFSWKLVYFSGIFATISDKILSLYFISCNMLNCTIDLDDQTTMNFWVTNHRRFNKPNLVLIHGYGGHSRWQFLSQVWPLSQSFNLYIPDLLFFGMSYTNHTGRSDIFQAMCVREGLKKLGLDRYNLAGLSYGGYVVYWMAGNFEEEVEKVVILSSGICYTEEQKEEHFKKIGRNLYDLLLPQKPEHVRGMVKLSMYKTNPLKWVPDFVLSDLIKVMGDKHRKEKLELVEHLMTKKADTQLPILTQETLLIWGDQDNVFPVYLAHQLQRHLGPKSRVEIIKDTGHAANIESPDIVNSLITSFVLGHS